MSPVRTHRRRVAVATGMVVGVVAVPVGAPAKAESASTKITVEHDEQLKNTSRRTVQATKRGSGCEISWNRTVRPEDVPEGEVLVERMASLDTTSCVAVIESGSKPAPELRSTKQAPGTPAGGQAPSQQVTAAAAGQLLWSRAFLKTYWEDPPQIDVVMVKPVIEWKHNLECSARLGGSRTDYSWYTPSGWRRDSYSTTYGGNCYGVSQRGSARYFNGAFCGGFDTRAVFTNIQISGMPNRTYNISGNSYVDGACTELLSWHVEHGYEVRNRAF